MSRIMLLTVLCDLQGGLYHDGALLTDPVIMYVTK
jgi:hypothetical protein